MSYILSCSKHGKVSIVRMSEHVSAFPKGINREHEMHSSFYNFVIRNYVCHPVVSSSSLKMMEIKFLTFSNIFKR